MLPLVIAYSVSSGSALTSKFRVADPDLGNVILQRKKDFEQPPITAKIVGLLGPSVLTVSSGSRNMGGFY